MLHQLFNIPFNKSFVLACSGGVDSMAVADFYRRGGKNFYLAYFNHGTPQADQMQDSVSRWAVNNRVVFKVGYIKNKEKPKGLSPEEHWRNERYAWLNEVANGLPIVTCHHLNDCAETFLFGAINGNPKVIAARSGNILRPFLTTTKQDMIDWCLNHNVSWFEDKSNEDVSTPRNRIRHNIMKEALEINPGFLKVIKKKVIAYYNENPS